ncbi:MAG: 2-C-methyl-D-erythritol 2,4-cyclodiphosphate synthase [Gemmatimonadota bacterium]|nr:2-C-methyl-D-erythritol 2,4-cyclodiphosphate synthase [Gemmatimonadota bacterium]
MVRVGVGYDSHRFDEARPLTLGGIEIPGEPGLAGHSDADAICHAITDAVLGAAGLGDIGALFPDDDPAHEGADSVRLLADAVHHVREAGYTVGNVDVTVVAEHPRMAPLVPRMTGRLAPALGVDEGRISIKGKSNEGMGWIGRGEGIAAIAVATVVAIDRPPG